MKRFKIAFLILISSLVAHAKQSTLWDGECRNVTYQTDGHLKLFTLHDGSKIAGYISISGWLVGSGQIKGTQVGNAIQFTSIDGSGLPIRWEGVIRDKVLKGEYFIEAQPNANLRKQVGEFSVAITDTQTDGIATSEMSFRKLFLLNVETELNAPVKLDDGTVASGAEALFRAIHPAGQGVSIRVANADIEWKDGASRVNAEGIRRYTIDYILYWHGVLTTLGQTKMRLSYNANLRQVTEHTVIESTGITNSDVNQLTFAVGLVLGKAAVDALLSND